MSDKLEILNRVIEKLLKDRRVEEGSFKSDCLQPSVTDSPDIISDSDIGPKSVLEQVLNSMRYSTRDLKISLLYFFFSSLFGVGVVS